MNLRRRTQKRVSRAQELLINPSLLFLDEPASGLGSTMAKQILLVPWCSAKSGRAILMTIHWPASSLFYIFNKSSIVIRTQKVIVYTLGRGME